MSMPNSQLPLLLVTLLLLFAVNFYIVSLRLYFLYRQFGYPLKFGEACQTCLSGQVSNLFFIPFVGSMIGHQSKLSAKNIPNALIAFAVIYEKFFVSVLGGVLSVLSILLIFPTSYFSYANVPFQFVEALSVCALILTLFVFKDFNKDETRIAKSFFSIRSLKYTVLLSLITGLGWLVVSCAFVIGIAIVNQKLPEVSHIGGGVLTSFIASLPVSINGWGVRELASMKIFGALGINQNHALYVSLCVGVSSILAILALYILNFLTHPKLEKIKERYFKKHHIIQKTDVSESDYKMHKIIKALDIGKGNFRDSVLSRLIVKNIIGFMGYAVAFLIFFHFQMSYDGYSLSINVADIFAYAALFIYVSEIMIPSKKLDFSLPNIQSFLMIVTAVLTLSLFIGIISFGFNKWAFVSRYLGWFCLLGYFSLGALFRHFVNDRFVRRVVSILIFAISTILLVKYGIYFLKSLGFLNALVMSNNLEGYSLNRNAFAFQLLVVSLFLLIRCRDDGHGSYLPNLYALNLGLIIAGIIATASRSALICGAFLLLTYALIGTINFKQFARYTIASILAFGVLCILKQPITALNFAISLLEPLMRIWFNILILPKESANEFLLMYFSYESSMTERIYTIFQGLKMGWENPFLGAGLGAFVNQEMLLNNRFLVIHNVFVWLWAECGFVGLSVVAWFGCSVIKKLYSEIMNSLKKKISLRHEYTFLIGLFVIFLTMGMAHDIMYQRIFWFAFGLMVINKKSKYFLTEPENRI